MEQYQKTIAAFFTGHHHVGLRGWDDNWGIHEVIIPSNTWNSDEHIRDPKSGYADPDLRAGWMLATVNGNQIALALHPVGVPGPAARKTLG